MNYSIEEIFVLAGQFDKVVNVSFKFSSDSRKKYGDHITGEFIYTPEERGKLQKIVEGQDFPRTSGFVKFNSLLSELTMEQKKELKQSGINTEDIGSILQPSNNSINNYTNKETRSLPEPVEIKVDFRGVDKDALTINLYSRMISSGYKIIPYEQSQYYAAILNKHGDNIKDDNFKEIIIDKETGEIKKDIRYAQLERKLYSEEGLTTEEKNEFEDLIEEIMKVRVSISLRELEKSTEKFKELGINYPKALNTVTTLMTYFKPKRLTHSRFPVWWDYERFLHIYLRHVKNTQIGERFSEKTPFQYAFKDILSLIETVLKQIEKEIEEHFTKNPAKNFKRHGSMSVYYNGDYYVIQIAPDGQLMTFYKT